MSERYQWRSITHDDVGPWAELTNHLADVDGTEEFYDAGDRAEELDEPRVDPQRDTLAVWAGEAMVAFGIVRVKANPDRQGWVHVLLDGGIHADHRGRGLGTELMDRLEARGLQLKESRHPGTNWFFTTGGGLEGSSVRTFHLSRGYQVARYFNLMGRTLNVEDATGVPSSGEMLNGVSIRAPRREDEEAVFSAHAQAWADHWGSPPPAAGAWHSEWNQRSNRHHVSRLAIDSEGAFAAKGSVLAYSLCGQWVDRELYVNRVGTVPAARGRGLGSAVLAHTITAGAEGGDYDVVELDVDSDSPTGATRLYERLGFSVKHTSALMRKYPTPR